MRKKVEMGDTRVKTQALGGGGDQTCFITRAVTGSSHTPRSPTGAQGIAHNTFLTTSKICGIRAKKKKYSAQKKMCEYFFSAEYFLAQNFFSMRIIFSS